MANNLQGDTVEAVAYALMRDVMAAEDRTTGHSPGPGQRRIDRKYLLDLYAECLEAAGGVRRTADMDGSGAPNAMTETRAANHPGVCWMS
jgi:hypothetical protein